MKRLQISITLLLLLGILSVISCIPTDTPTEELTYNYTGYLTDIVILETDSIDNWARVNLEFTDLNIAKHTKFVNIYVRLDELPAMINSQQLYLKNLGAFAFTGRDIYSIKTIVVTEGK